MTRTLQHIIPSSAPKTSNTLVYPALFEDVPEVRFRRGDILSLGSPHYVYLIVLGMVKQSMLHGDREVFDDYVQAGEFINGEILFDEVTGLCRSTVLADNTVVKKIPTHLFLQEARANQEIVRSVMKSLRVANRRSKERAKSLSLLKSEQRIIHFLLSYAQRSGQKVGFELMIKPVLTHEEIGQITSTSRQTVTTVLNDLRRGNYIHFNRRYLLIRDLKKLTALLDYPLEVLA